MQKPTVITSDVLFINEQAAAIRYGIGIYVLRRWRLAKQGPPYIKLGNGPKSNIRYHVSTVDEWFKQKTINVGK